ncbi:MAG: dTMP kinase [Fimbriimonadaceae bacterium]|nr:dTMP kinase [Fimbriimonadaceae bacterium]
MPGLAVVTRGRFFTFEGVDGVGKSTQLDLLAAWLGERGHTVLLTAEPGGTPLGQELDRLLKDPATPTVPRAEALLFLAARAQHVDAVLRPALASGQTVLCSRFSDSTLAYQCAGLGLPEPAIRAADAFAREGLQPDAVVIFDAPPEVVAQRRAARAGSDRIEARAAEFHARVRDGFRALHAADPQRVLLLPAAGDAAHVQQRLRTALEPWL